MKLENEWRHVKYLIINETSMVGLSLLVHLNRIVTTANHISSNIPFGGFSNATGRVFLRPIPVPV